MNQPAENGAAFETEKAIADYLRVLEQQPELATAHFNLALLYKQNRCYAEALASYENAVRLEIEDVQEVYSNMGVLLSEMRKGDEAKAMYEQSLGVDPEYVPALFNLAALFEEGGDRQQATELYQRILSGNPTHWDSLARLTHAKTISSEDGAVIDSLRAAIENTSGDRLAREGLYFALGKALDDLQRYEEAIAAYNAANEIGMLRNPPYDRRAAEQAFQRLIDLFDAGWIGATETRQTASPIFICGMYRSGSTLIEQILAAHPMITAGGELEILPWLLARRLAPVPQIANTSREDLQNVGDEYLSGLKTLFPDQQNVTDKRLDNFLHLGLIRALFPNARIIYTKRAMADNCLSVYFQQFGGNLSYATDLGDIAHYYKQHEQLMNHWQSCLGQNIFTVDYDELVRTPQPVLRGLVDFLGLDWDDRCLSFHQTDSLVKTASVWQVRQELHSASSGRWKNYAPFIPNADSLN